MVAAVINTIVGGGSFLTLPLLVFLGLPPLEANATNRLGVCFQLGTATLVLRKRTDAPLRVGLTLSVAAALGGVAGVFLAEWVDELAAYRQAMAWILLGAGCLLFLRPRKKSESSTTPESSSRRLVTQALAFLIGVYGGFLGPGVGVLVLLLLTPMLRLDLVSMVAIKVLLVFALSLSASIVNLLHGSVEWGYAIPLILGNICGGAIGARLALKGGNKLIRVLLVVVTVALALRLLLD